MARPREFDEGAVLDAARNEFWTHGIAATSISRLSEATGLSVGSIYKAFDSKGALCERVLDRYLDGGYALLDQLLDAGDSPVDGIDRWLGAIAAMAGHSGGPRGCFAVVCAVEVADSDEAIGDRLRRHDDRVIARVADAFRAAEAAGATLTVPPLEAARFVYNAVTGVQVASRKGITAADAGRILHLARTSVLP